MVVAEFESSFRASLFELFKSVLSFSFLYTSNALDVNTWTGSKDQCADSGIVSCCVPSDTGHVVKNVEYNDEKQIEWFISSTRCISQF